MGCQQLTYQKNNFLKVVHRKNGQVQKKNVLDYFSFGMPMPNRNVEGNYRYGYQGEHAEKEPELEGVNSFQLRLYDSRIGRWLTPDPKNEFFSPYLAMGNNPIIIIDPDGGMTSCPDPPCWEGGVQELDAVMITAHKPGSDGWRSFLNRAKNLAIKSGQHLVVMSVASINAWSSDQVLGAGRQGADIYDGSEFALSHRAGQLVGDLAAMVTGGAEIEAGATLAAGGVLATPATGGVSLVGTAAGVGVVAHGGTVVLTGGWNAAAGIKGLIDHMSKGSHSNSGGGDKFKKLKSNKDANDYAKSKGYDDAHDLKASHVGKGNESKFDIEVNSQTGEGRLISKDGKTIVPIY